MALEGIIILTIALWLAMEHDPFIEMNMNQ